MTARAASAPAGSDGLFFMPYLTGERLGAHRNARAQFFGLGAAHGLAHLHRAVLEGVAFAAARHLRIMEKAAGRRLERVIASGGGARTPLWLKIKASVYGAPIVVPKEPECGVVGCAALAATAAGRFARTRGRRRRLRALCRRGEARSGLGRNLCADAAGVRPALRAIPRRSTTTSTPSPPPLNSGFTPWTKFSQPFAPTFSPESAFSSRAAPAASGSASRRVSPARRRGDRHRRLRGAPRRRARRREAKAFASSCSTCATARRSTLSSAHSQARRAGQRRRRRQAGEGIRGRRLLDVMDVNLNSVMRLSMAAQPLLGEVEGLDRQRRLDAELSRRRRRPGLLRQQDRRSRADARARASVRPAKASASTRSRPATTRPT